MSSDLIVHIVDDDVAVRQSMAFLFATAGISTRLHELARAFLASGFESGSGCIVTDIRMPEMDGIELQKELKNRSCTMPVIVITGHGDVPLAVAAMKEGAVEFIEKPFDDAAIIKAVRTALEREQGKVDRSSEVTELCSRLERLSEREHQVLNGLVAGHSNKVIASSLGISPRTVEIYRAHVMTKMQARSLSHLVQMWVAGQEEA